MSYATAKTNFEAVVKTMQADLQRYIDSGKANQRAVDVRLEIINKLVEFYEAAEVLCSELDIQNAGTHFLWSHLHTDTQKLVYWSQLHRGNPNQVFHYEVNELRLMVATGRRFGRCEDLYRVDDRSDHQNEIYNNQTEKYLTTSLICSRNLHPLSLISQ